MMESAAIDRAVAHVERELRTAREQRAQLQRYVDGVEATRRLLAGEDGGIARSIHRDAMVPLFPLERRGAAADDGRGAAGEGASGEGPQPIAFMRGRIVHTNEMLVCLGAGHYAEMSAAQASDHLGKRLGAARGGPAPPAADAALGTVTDALRRAGDRCSVLEERLFLLKAAPRGAARGDAGGDGGEADVEGMSDGIFLDEGDEGEDGRHGGDEVPVCPVATTDLRLSGDGLLRMSDEQFAAEERVFRDVRVLDAERRRRQPAAGDAHFTGRTEDERERMMARFRAMEMEELELEGEEEVGGVRAARTGGGREAAASAGGPAPGAADRERPEGPPTQPSSPFVGNVVERWDGDRGGAAGRQHRAQGPAERAVVVSKFKQRRMGGGD